MPQNPEEINDVTTQDLMLQKLGDIEGVVTMLLQKGGGGDIGDGLEILQQLLVKLIGAVQGNERMDTELIKTLKALTEKVEKDQTVNVTLEIV